MKMGRCFIFTMMILSFVGCASKKISYLPGDDLKSRKGPPHKRFADRFRKKLGENDVLALESAARFSEARLEGLEESEDPLAQVVASCVQGNHDGGLDILNQNYLLYKKHPGFWNQMGNCYFLKGEISKAILYYNKSREINPKYAPPVNNLGVVYQKRGSDQKALVAFKKALKLASYALTPNFNLAQLYLKYGMVKRASAIFSNLYRKNDADNDVINGLATCHLMQGKIDKALAFFDKIDYKAVRNPTIALNYAVALKIKGEFKQAKNVLDKMDGPQSSELRKYKEEVYHFIEGTQ